LTEPRRLPTGFLGGNPVQITAPAERARPAICERQSTQNTERILNIRIMLAFAIWMLAWLLWSGLYTPLLVTLGLLSCGLTVFLARRIGFFKENYFSPGRLMRLLPFWGWLGKELVKSNLQVARIVLSPRLPISPTVVKIRAAAQDPLGQAILGNAITLTPGTVTLDDHEGELLVHCLVKETADELVAGEMNRRVAATTEAD
jgi:multicomponent Na+:H+ antiporter subunit E